MASTRQKKKVEKVMHEHKRGSLRSGSGSQLRRRASARPARHRQSEEAGRVAAEDQPALFVGKLA
jgi:hypothetical protein